MRNKKTTKKFLLTFTILAIISIATLAQGDTIAEYLDQLNYKEASARAYAAYALGQIGDADFVDALIPLLSDEDKYVRAIVAEALGRIGDISSVEALSAALQDKERVVRWNAAKALKRINPDEQYEIARYMNDLNDPDASVRFQAANKLSELVPEKSQQYQIARYINDLEDADVQVQASAASALRIIGDKSAVQPLISALNDHDALVRQNAAAALGQIVPRLKDAAVANQAIAPLVSRLQDKSALVSESAAIALAEIGEPAVSSLVNAVNGDNAMVRAIAVDILGKIHPENLREYKLSRYTKDLKDRSVSVRADAAMALGSILNERAVDPLISALKDVDSSVRQNAADALIKIGEPAIRPLIPLLKSQNTSAQLHAAIAFRGIGIKLGDSSKLNPATDAVVAAFVDTASPIHSIATQILREIGVYAVDSLTVVLNDEDDAIRAMAAKMLAEIQPQKTNYYQSMRYMNDLKSSDASVRSTAANALGILGKANAVNQLIALFGDNDASVRKNAANAVEQIGIPAIEPLITALSAENRNTRRYAFITLAGIAPKAQSADLQLALTPAVDALRDIDSSIRSAAAKILVHIDEPAVRALISLFEDLDGSMHSISARVLIQIGNTAVEALEMALNDQSSIVRKNAAAVLTRIAPYRAEQYQITRYINDLKDTDATVRITAAHKLGRMHDTRAVEPLIAALNDSDFRVRANAADSLAYLADRRAIEPLKRVEDDDEVDLVNRIAKESLERLERLPKGK